MVKDRWRRPRAFPWVRGAVAALLIYACSFDDSDSDSGDSNSDSGGSDSGGSDSAAASSVVGSSSDDNGDSMSADSSSDGDRRRRRARDAMVVRPDGQPDPDALSPRDYGDIPPS